VDVARSTLFYRLMHTMSTQLKGLIVPYYGHLIDPCVLLLQALTPSLAAAPHRTKRRRAEAADGDEEATSAAHAALLQAPAPMPASRCSPLPPMQCILDALHSCALYDTINLLDGERFPKLLEPVAAQLENLLGGEAEYQRRTEGHLIPCLVQFAVTVHDDALWKPLHHAVLRRTRSDVPAVRLAALTVVQQFFNRLGEAYLVMLPETVPYLAELMEDSHAEVEALCQRVIKDIEQLSGESLQEYFS
jgi:U3 small nucleolar RNA-associated protein 10